MLISKFFNRFSVCGRNGSWHKIPKHHNESCGTLGFAKFTSSCRTRIFWLQFWAFLSYWTGMNSESGYKMALSLEIISEVWISHQDSLENSFELFIGIETIDNKKKSPTYLINPFFFNLMFRLSSKLWIYHILCITLRMVPSNSVQYSIKPFWCNCLTCKRVLKVKYRHF